MNFLSRESIIKHKGFLNELKLKYSVVEKSYPAIKGLGLKEIFALPISREVKREAIELKTDIMLHETYFNSFSDNLYKSEAVKKLFSSEAAFLYELEKEADISFSCGFLLVYSDKFGKLGFKFSNEPWELLMKNTLILAIDLWEHAYFDDYGFDRKRYVKITSQEISTPPMKISYAA